MKVTVSHLPGRPKPWRVQWYESSKARARYFATEGEATARKAEIEGAFEKGGMAAVKTIELDAGIEEAKRIAESLGRTVLEMVRSAAADAKSGSGPTLFEARFGFEARNTEMNLRPKTLQFYVEQLDSLLRTLGEGKRTGDVTRQQVRAWIDSKPVRSRPHALRAARSWFRWMLAQEPPLIGTDPTFGMRVETPKGGRSIGFLTHGQAKALLGAAEPKVRPALALMLFAGIRHNELHREAKAEGVDVLQWSDIDIPNKAITVRHEVAKTGVARTVRNIPENLWAWLPADQTGPVCPVHLRASLERARLKLENPPTWSKSILRHSCASHHAAAFENLPATALLIRHEGDVTLLNRRYREGVKITKADGLAYYGIIPA